MQRTPIKKRVWYRSAEPAVCPICLEPLRIVTDSVVFCVNDQPVTALRVGASLNFGRIEAHNDVVIRRKSVSRSHGILHFYGNRILAVVDADALNARHTRLVNADTKTPRCTTARRTRGKLLY